MNSLPPPNQILAISFVILFFWSCCHCPKEPTVNKKYNSETVYDFILSRDDARKMLTRYRGDLPSAAANSGAVWFEKDLIRILNDSLQRGHFNADGVRLYFSAYHDNILNPGKEGRLTIFMVPTYPDRTFAGKPYHRDTFAIKRGSIFIKNVNHGELCPDECDESGAW